MLCYNNKVLRINLSTKTTSTEPLNMDNVKKYIGGRGLGVKMLMDEIDPLVDPLSEGNKIIIMSGPLTGVKVSTGTRYMVVTKSPLNNFVTSSNSGGIWGSMLKYAGYDAIIIEGKATSPVYVKINDDKVSIEDASTIWGTTSKECDDALKTDANTSVLSIGPAGETLSLMAAVMNDVERAAGRSGVGAVMGSKKLKAIVVTSSNRDIKTFDGDKFKETATTMAKTLKAHPVTGEGLPTYGTAVLVNIINSVGSFPTRNWQEGYFSDAENVSGEAMASNALTKNTYCHHCTIGCGREVKMDGQNVGGPEYETLWGFSGNSGIGDLDSIIKANYWCNELGLDTISTATTIATAMELNEIGFIKE
ncbi:MAG: aldehyde ferredoxin oxidoreductase family protein, partial [Bacilli bacterium]